MHEIRHLISQICSGVDISLEVAGRLEVLLDGTFPENAEVQDVVEMLARYKPGGGEFLYDIAELQNRLARFAHRLDDL